MNGVVPESVFVQNVQTLGLGQAERDRLRRELARLGLHVQDVRVHVDADSPDVEKVARIRGENVFPGADLVQALLLRYADTDGYVTSRAVDGVARLAGLVHEVGAVFDIQGESFVVTGIGDRPSRGRQQVDSPRLASRLGVTGFRRPGDGQRPATPRTRPGRRTSASRPGSSAVPAVA